MSQLWGIPDNWAPSIDGSDQLKQQYMQAQIQHLGAMTQQEQIKSRQEQMQMRVQQQMMQQMAQKAGQKVQQSDSMESQFDQLIDYAWASGDIAKAGRLMAERQRAIQEGDSARLARDKLKDAEADRATKQQAQLRELFAPANSQEDVNQAVATANASGLQVPPGYQVYDKAKFDYLKKVTKAGTQEEKEDRADARLDKRLNNSNAQLDARLADSDKRQLRYLSDLDKRQGQREAELEKRRIEAEERQNKRDAKLEEWRRQDRLAREKWEEEQKKANGTARPGAPDTNMLRAASLMVKKDYPNLPDEMFVSKDDKVPQAAYDIASQAKVLMAANRGLSADQAMAKVYQDKRAKGEFRNVAPPEKHWYEKDTPGKDAYEPGAKPAAQATKTPTAKTEEDNKALTWAKANPKDPRAKKILELNHE